MRTLFTLTALALAGLSLSACDKTPPAPVVGDVRIETSVPPAGTPGPWLPAADSASAPAPVATLPPTGERSNRALSSEQESNSTPMAGQNNDHSAPLTPAKPASSP